MHLSGQISGQVTDQAGAMFVGLSQQNRDSYQAQMHQIGGQRKLVMDPETLKARRFMQEKILECLMQRQPQSNELPTRKIFDIVKRLEDGLFKTASTKEEYMNLDTLENRLHSFIKRAPMSTSNSQQQQFVSPSPVGTMIPTPGMPHHGNSNSVVSSSVDTSAISSSGYNNMPSSAGASGNMLPVANGLLASGHGASFHTLDGGNIISAMGDQRVMSQMIPTPGFNNSSSDTIMNVEADGNVTGVSSATSLSTSQRALQKHPISAQSSRMTHTFGNQIDSGARPNVHPRSYASVQNVSANGAFGSYEQPFIGSGSSESYSTTTATFGGSSRSSQRQFDQQSHSLVQGDGYGLNAADSALRGDFSGPATSAVAIMNNQYLDSARSHISPRSNLLMSGKSNSHSIQPDAHSRAQSSDTSEKFNSNQSVQSPRGSYLMSHQPQHHQSHQLQQQQTFLLHQGRQKLAGQQHIGAFKNTRLQSSDFSAHVKADPSVEHTSEALQLSEFQTQFQQRCENQLSPLPSSNEFCSSLPPNHQNMLQPNQFVAEANNQYDCLPSPGVQSETSMQGNWHPESDNRSSLPGNTLVDQKVQSELRQRLTGHDEAQYNSLPTAEGSTSGEDALGRGAAGTLGSGAVLNKSFNSYRDRQFFNQQKWLLILRHARSCKEPEGKCSDYCFAVRKLWRHIDSCSASHCTYPRCQRTKSLILHNKRCRSPQCPVCVPVNNRLMAEWKKIRLSRESGSGLQNQGHLSGGFKSSNVAASARDVSSADVLQPFPATVETTEADSQLSVKRLKTELPSYAAVPESGNAMVALNSSTESHPPFDVKLQESYNSDHKQLRIKSEVADFNMEASRNSVPTVVDMKKDSFIGVINGKINDGQIINDNTSIVKQEIVKYENNAAQVKQEDNLQSSDHSVETKSGKPKIKGVSLTELFTPEQVREHIKGLRQWVGQSKVKAEKNQAMERSMSENSCQLCAVEKLTFEPPPIYCTKCNSRIKRNALYYTAGTGDTRHYICVACYSGGDSVSIDGSIIPKTRFERKKNDEETEEWWVQCDKCEAWQHQICALFNGRRNDGGQAEYTCPNCYIQEIENGERKPLPQSALLGAKDLPRTLLSDYIEQRLFKKLKEERQKRAGQEGKSYDEVPGADGLVVRVVSSVDKKLEVKPRFLEIFREENYPAEFSYKSKVILLFQKIEGVEVCLFGMYVQEFGSECLPPNQRRVYLSYLDSVKYFRPEVRAVTGETVRTLVYHEILIGYLDYCKKRGFTSCYIWACPPVKGEDYILYCHPEIQKIPKPDKLREWYLSMLRKACKENIVVELTNLYDHFFVSTGECKAKVTAARLPYFEGDYWPGAAEETIEQLNREDDGRKNNKKGVTKKMFTKRTLKATGQVDLSSNASKDLLLMHRLGETIHPMKDVFIMVHLQHSCTHCCVLMVSGNRWVCKQCKKFQICDNCYEAEQKLDERERHPIGHKEKHALHPIEITDVPEDTEDKDEILESEFFDTRQAFLSLCQGNHYQFDTLRRAKHSSMMVLYHLHNPTAPAYVTTCNICHLDIEAGLGWRCETCPEYDVCNACYQKEGGIDHPHKLTNYPSLADRDAQSTEARQLRVLQLRKMLDLLVHASQCRSLHCQYPNCRKVKGLFRHGISCRIRASGGCVLCKKMWYLLQLHARACKESECHVPRCRDLRDHLKRLQQQSDSRRRAAVVEMMRQRAAEVAGSAGNSG